MLPTLLSRVQQLFEFVHSKPLPAQLAVFLGENFCPLGETSAVAVSLLQDDGKVICNSAYGFQHNDRMIGSTSSILSDRPGSEALMKLRTMILSQSDVENKYPDFIKQDFMEGYKSAVLMPVGMRKIYGIAMQESVEKVEGFEQYAECVRSLLNFYENFIDISTDLNAMKKSLSTSKSLTARQSEIVRLIRDGKTNSAIANDLGFSESLIRQETIFIYRKLGITGRKDLLPEMKE